MIHGKNTIGYELLATEGKTIQSINPQTGEPMEGDFHIASSSEISLALQKAGDAYKIYKKKSGKDKADFLEAIADEIVALGEVLVKRAMAETALPEGRIVGERGRTVGQLKLFAALLRDGTWVEASIDKAIPDREPLPKSDIRKMLVPTGPVLVFTASNFPLAFSTAGGDTASALAAGNPVIVKAHESHLGTNELIAGAISLAAKKTGMPDGVFSSLTGSGFELGKQLILHPVIKSMAFTGSFNGGKALYDMASGRPDPIPVFSEMGSINPVLILPENLKENGDSLATSYAGSITLGTGQFCTNPGLMIGLVGEELERFIGKLSAEIEKIAPSTMLNGGIAENYNTKIQSLWKEKGVKQEGKASGDNSPNKGVPTVASATGTDFIRNPVLHEEIFGPFSLIIKCADREEMGRVIEALKGQLTVTVLGNRNDLSSFAAEIENLKEICGRIIFKGVPTGVEVCHSMFHGGPFPATTDNRFTSVGTDAIKRFVRPMCFQDAPENMLPDELKNDNPLNIWRKIDGVFTKDKI
ncbi:MAG: aldehyde dehydrogenase (NADP(+)) [Cyclobacteriaceae bacterium]|nr:aldehyde dehydrogenase (NADP(+)) [Cyclobacteriaceae bacterium]